MSPTQDNSGVTGVFGKVKDEILANAAEHLRDAYIS
jgi:hypothetical protein